MLCPIVSTLFAMIVGVVLFQPGIRPVNGYLDYEDPCQIYSTLLEDWRDPQAGTDPTHCDSNIYEGWYTFYLGNDPAIIPTECMQDNTCGGRVPLHVDLEGQDLPEPGETLNASLCGSYNVLDTIYCCVFRQPTQIKVCTDPDAVIYYLRPQQHCPVTVCTVRAKDGIADRQYRFEPGDVPRSKELLADTTSLDTTSMEETTTKSSHSIETTTADVTNTSTEMETSTDSLQTVTPYDSFTGSSVQENNTIYPFASLNDTSLDSNPSVQINDTLAQGASVPDSINTTFAMDTNSSVTLTTSIPDATITTPNTGTFTQDGQSRSLDDSSTTTTSDMVDSTKSQGDSTNSSGVCFVLRGNFEKSHFLYTLQTFVTTLSTFFNPQAKTSTGPRVPFLATGHMMDNKTIISTAFITDIVGETITMERLIEHMRSSIFKELMFNKTGLRLLAVCLCEENCHTLASAKSTASNVSATVFDHYLPLLIVLIVLVAVLLLIFPMVRLCRHLSKQGSWAPPLDQEKCPQPATDNFTTEAKTPLHGIANGDQLLSQSEASSGQDKGLVDESQTVDQSQTTSTTTKSEDTPM